MHCFLRKLGITQPFVYADVSKLTLLWIADQKEIVNEYDDSEQHTHDAIKAKHRLVSTVMWAA